MSQRSPRVPSDDARRRILDATRELLLDRPFAALTVGDVMTRAGWLQDPLHRGFERVAQKHPVPTRMRWNVFVVSPGDPKKELPHDA